MSRGVVVWIAGPPSSGKSTLARRVRGELSTRGRFCALLDGDEVRAALDPAPGYDARGRDQFYATLARLAALLARQDLIVLVAATSHLRAYGERARELAPRFVEVYLRVPVEECARRDSKGLYAAARAGAISDFPGVDLASEVPLAPEVIAEGGRDEAALASIVALAV